MIIGTGLDAVSIRRFTRFVERWGEHGLRRVFTETERSYCGGLVDPLPSLAARFAAKEAFFKAVGTGWGLGGGWMDVEVQRDGAGRPWLLLHNRAARVAQSRGADHVHLSLSHTADLALAQVVLES